MLEIIILRIVLIFFFAWLKNVTVSSKSIFMPYNSQSTPQATRTDKDYKKSTKQSKLVFQPLNF